MTKYELLELAAKAADFEYECTSHTGYPEHDQHQIRDKSGALVDWNPITDDGDALRLAVALQLTIDLYLGQIKQKNDLVCYIHSCIDPETGLHAKQPNAEVVRAAIVRAAAEIGKTM